MTVERQITAVPENQISTKRGFPVYRTNPSVPQTNGLPTRTKRINVPGGKGSVIVDNTTGELKGIGGLGFWWEEEVDTTRFVKLFLDGIKQAAGLSKTGIQVFELVYHEMRANPGSDEIKLNQYVQGSRHQRPHVPARRPRVARKGIPLSQSVRRRVFCQHSLHVQRRPVGVCENLSPEGRKPAAGMPLADVTPRPALAGSE